MKLSCMCTFKHIQLAINEKVVHQWPLQDVKSPKTPYRWAPSQNTAIKRPTLLNKRQTLVFLYNKIFVFLRLSYEMDLNDGAFLTCIILQYLLVYNISIYARL